MAKRAKPGDVLELSGPDAVVYLHYLGKHSEYGDAVMVSPIKRASPIEIDGELFRNGYVAFFPVVAAVSKGLTSVVGKLTAIGVPERLCRPGARSTNKVETWVIEGRDGELVRSTLTDAERESWLADIGGYQSVHQEVSSRLRSDRIR